MTEIKCPNCGSKDIKSTGITHGVGNLAKVDNKIPPTTSEGYQCRRCKKFFIGPKS